MSRSETYKSIEIVMNNVGSRVQAEVDNEFRLVRAAIDAGYFAASAFPGGKTVTKIKIVGPTHCTTNSQSGVPVADPSHLTLTANPGGKTAHLYLNPVDGTTATATTSVKNISW